MKMLKRLEGQIRGWLPKEPSLPRPQLSLKSRISEMRRRERAEWENKFFKAFLVANAVVVNVFLGIRFLVFPFNRSLEFAVIWWSIFALTLTLVSLLMYGYYKKRASLDGGTHT
jgi:hypothetical protein